MPQFVPYLDNLSRYLKLSYYGEAKGGRFNGCVNALPLSLSHWSPLISLALRCSRSLGKFSPMQACGLRDSEE